MREKIRQFITAKFPDAIVGESDFRNQIIFRVKPEYLFDICRAFTEDDTLGVNMLADVTCVDWLGHPQESEGRFEVVYNLYAVYNKFRFFLLVRLPESNPTIPSLTPIWNGANWLEREVWDLFGINFEGHPEQTKILTPDELEGHPLRKDFPLTWEQPVFSWNKNDPPEVIK